MPFPATRCHLIQASMVMSLPRRPKREANPAEGCWSITEKLNRGRIGMLGKQCPNAHAGVPSIPMSRISFIQPHWQAGHAGHHIESGEHPSNFDRNTGTHWVQQRSVCMRFASRTCKASWAAKEGRKWHWFLRLLWNKGKCLTAQKHLLYVVASQRSRTNIPQNNINTES